VSFEGLTCSNIILSFNAQVTLPVKIPSVHDDAFMTIGDDTPIVYVEFTGSTLNIG
jgi:hypothetical protein